MIVCFDIPYIICDVFTPNFYRPRQRSVGVVTPICGPGTSSGCCLDRLSGLTATPFVFHRHTFIDTQCMQPSDRLLHMLARSTDTYTSYIDTFKLVKFYLLHVVIIYEIKLFDRPLWSLRDIFRVAELVMLPNYPTGETISSSRRSLQGE